MRCASGNTIIGQPDILAVVISPVNYPLDLSLILPHMRPRPRFTAMNEVGLPFRRVTEMEEMPARF